MGVPRGNSGLLLLRYIVADCHNAAACMRGWNPAREGYYLDQASTYGMELTLRNRAI